MPEFSYHQATPEELAKIFEKDIAEHPEDDFFVKRRDEYAELNRLGKAVTFVVTADDEPIGRGTLFLSPDCPEIGGKLTVADNISVANINDLHIHRDYRGEGHISALVRRMEAHARMLRLHALTIGADAAKPKNLAIYLHWGYTSYVAYSVENGVPVLYYKKLLD